MSSVLRGSAVSERPSFSVSSLSRLTCSGSTLQPTRKFSDWTVLTFSATASANLGTISKMSSHRGQMSASA
ncbi:hypothetical protein AUQ37_01020 [Candidatus Methanomethylophilus sp. 1R26]|nr:hypothetical protein AUQ37_01020 [Candidatus Methanomethylophilus sp. 1R26]